MAFLVSAAATLVFIIYCFVLDSESLCGATGNFWYVMCRLFANHIKLTFKLVFWLIVAGFLIFGSLSAAAEGAGASPMPTGGGPESEKFFRTVNKATWPIRAMVDGFIAICGALAMLVCVLSLGNTGPLPVWKAQTSFGQGYIIYDGTHFQKVEALAPSPRCIVTGECAETSEDAPTFNHSGGRTQDGGITWLDLGTPDEARHNFPDDEYIPSTSFWEVGIVGEYQPHRLIGNVILFALYLLWLWVTASDVVRDEYSDRSDKEYTLLSLAAIGAWAVVVLAAAWGIRRLFAGTWS